MNQVLQNVRTGSLEIGDVPAPALRPGGVLVRNAASLISAGTEKMVVDFARKSLLSKARERPDLVQQVVTKVRNDGLGSALSAVSARLEHPLPLGYSCAGVVEAVGEEAPEFAAGDRVACAGMGYASHADLVFVPRNLAVRIADGVAYEDACYVALGATAVHGVRIVDVRFGESVAVIGLGLLGLLTVQILKAAGCRVLGVDIDEGRVELARALGADAACLRSADPLAHAHALTDGAGVDAVLIAAATKSADPIELAGRLCRDRGRVGVVGAVRMDVPRRIFYEKELELRLSRSYGPGRYDRQYEEGGIDYPLSYVRWTERRNMEEFLRLVATGAVTPARMTTHSYPVAEAQKAYEIVTGGAGERFVGVVLTYPGAPAPPSRTVSLRARRAVAGTVGLGVIGAGSFARSVLLPRLERIDGASLVGIATATGVSARGAADRFDFAFATTDVRRILDDDDIHAVVIATRHDSHAELAAAALKAGKAVFVEKPLAIAEAQLQVVAEAVSAASAVLAVGFNRRFAPLGEELKVHFAHATPLAISYTVNAGAIPPDSWIHDPSVGGGRIIGEVCHFVDFAQFLTDDEPTDVYARALGDRHGRASETVSINLAFARGSTMVITYAAVGDRGYPKERIEVFGGGRVGVLEDFRRLETWRDGKCRRRRRRNPDKGHARQLETFVDCVAAGTPYPIDPRSAITTTRCTFAIEESIRTRQPVRIAPDAR